MSATTSTQLDRYQQASLDRAADVLAADHGYDPDAMAYRIGQLEWHLGELLTLVGQLIKDAR